MSRSAPAKRPPSPSTAAARSAVEGAWAAKMDRLRQRARPQNRLRICDDDRLRQQFEEARETAARARLLADASPGDERGTQHAAEAAAALEEARAALDDASDFLTFLALPRPVLEELISQHPPTEEQADEGSVFNPDTFPAALAAALVPDEPIRAPLLAPSPRCSAVPFTSTTMPGPADAPLTCR